MAQIKIIAVPDGEAPEWVRIEWVGVVLPLADECYPVPTEAGVLTFKSVPTDGKNYPVRTTEAIRELEKTSPAAARWWKKHVNPEITQWLIFQRDVCVYDPR